MIARLRKDICSALGYAIDGLSDDAFMLRWHLLLEDGPLWSLCERNHNVIGQQPDGELFLFTLENLIDSEKQSLRERIEARAAAMVEKTDA
jgi:hypothetical protein